MQKTVPVHLVSTYQLLQRAFPNGIDEQEYLPLLAILYKHMSDRSLAQVIAEYSGRDYYVVLNDVYQVGATQAQLSDAAEHIKQKLMACDYEKWLADE